MNGIDYAIVIVYLATMIALGFLFKKNKSGKDYFLGNKQFGWFALCLSVMATQLSVISFVSAPAFVGLRPGGGMQWLTFEFGVPVAMAILIATIAPSLFRSGVVSIYTFLEKRFGRSSRLLMSTVFLLGRSLATSVGIYAVTLILSSILGLLFWQTIFIVAGITVIYSFEGGLKAIVYSEVAQMIIKFCGIIIIMFFALRLIGGWNGFLQNVDRSRLQAVRFSDFGFDGKEYGFWPMLLGGIFLYCSYYGVDQTQAQRILSSKDEKTVKKLLLFNGLLRFPVTLCYCLGGLFLGTFYKTNARFASMIPLNKPDLMVPVFLTHYLPHGIIGIIVVSLLAAAMSSFSSTLNSLSAVTMEDFITKRENFNAERYVRFSKVASILWGVVIITLAFFVGDLATTVIEAVNKVGSLFYGPVLAMFTIGFYNRKISATSINAGLICGVLANIILWLFFKNVFWFWWNVIGFGITSTVSLFFTYVLNFRQEIVPESKAGVKPHFLTKETAILLIFFVLMFALCLLLPKLF